MVPPSSESRDTPVNLDQLRFEELGYRPNSNTRVDFTELSTVPAPHKLRAGDATQRELLRTQFPAE